jgi:hypothetical protein
VPFSSSQPLDLFRPDSNELLQKGVPSNNMTQITPLVYLISLYLIIPLIYENCRNAMEPRTNCAEVILMMK